LRKRSRDAAATNAGDHGRTREMGWCSIEQLTDRARRGVATGWFYDDDPTDPASRLTSECAQRITLSAIPSSDMEYHLHCCP
jgi:hypothetical protein